MVEGRETRTREDMREKCAGTEKRRVCVRERENVMSQRASEREKIRKRITLFSPAESTSVAPPAEGNKKRDDAQVANSLVCGGLGLFTTYITQDPQKGAAVGGICCGVASLLYPK